MQLNPQQQAAVHHISTPLLVLAGAGSGKTRVITEKIAYLIRQCQYAPQHIAAVTFTNKAAREMRERVQQTLGRERSRGLKISTFHTLGLTILKREYLHVGLQSGFSLFDDQDTLKLLTDLTEQTVQGDKDTLKTLQYRIGHYKNAMLLPSQLPPPLTPEDRLVQQTYAHYQDHLKAYNAVDFDDLILLPSLLLKNNDTVLTRWRQRIRYLLVDEYQDTNSSQYALVKLLIGDRNCLTVVGDDDQSIYSWRGAQPENLAILQQDFPTLKVIKLEQNYRSVGRILKAANILIENNPHVFDKKLYSNLEYGPMLKVIYGKNEDNEAERVVAEIIKERFLNKNKYGDFAILYRGNFQSRAVEKVLMLNKIPYKITGGQSIFARAEIKDIMAYLRLIVNTDDNNAFLRIINTPRRGVGPQTLEQIGLFAHEQQSSLFDAITHPELETRLSTAAYKHIQHFVELIQNVQRAMTGEAEDVLPAVHELLRQVQYEDYLLDNSASPQAAEMRIRNMYDLLGWLKGMLEGDADQDAMNLDEAVNRLMLRDMLSRQEDGDTSEQVQLMTLHASKGLEFPFVYMIGMEEGLLPHQASIDSDDVEEERRLAYVGITRAQRQLTFTLARERRQYGEVIHPEPSRFLLELPQDDLEWETQKKTMSQDEKRDFAQASIDHIRQLLNK